MTSIRAFVAAVVRAARRLTSGIASGARRLKPIVSGALVALAGRWQWQAPTWMTWGAARVNRAWRHLAARPGRAAVLALVVLSAAGAYAWYATRPTPHRVTFAVNAPGLTEYTDKGISSIKPLTIVFSESAAPLALVQKEVADGVDLAPAIAGRWVWTSDRQLQFTPKDDWPVDGVFTGRFARKGLVASQMELETYGFMFRTQPFSARITQRLFYQDPVNPALKKLVATVAFSHPVDTERFESRVSLAVARDAEYLGLTPDSRHFTVTYDKFRLSAFIHSAALAMPRDDTPMTLRIDKGVRAARGGNDTAGPLSAVVTIPGRTSLRFSDASMTVVDNARYEPEQILLFDSSSPVSERAFAGAVSARLLPIRHPKQAKEDKRPYRWVDPAEIGNDILATSEMVSLSYVPSEEGGNTSHGFKFLAPVGRYLHVTVREGVQGIGGYVSGKPYVATVKVDPYRRALTFLGQGSIVSVTGDKKVGFLSRDVERVEIEVGRILPNQLQHLVPVMSDFSRPGLYGSLADRLVERLTDERDYSGKPPGKPTYDSIDLASYLHDGNDSRRGLFLLRIHAKGTLRRGDNADDAYRGDGEEIEDRRLILVTDLGVIVKDAKDGSRDVFVQSIRTGLPVDGARVEILGRNGQPVATVATGATGRAHLPRIDPEEATREKTPEVIVAQKDGDLSFLPFDSRGRGLNLSRFDTGGIENAESAQQLSAYLFSDRGIYRPGETAHLGLIVRTADWKASLAGLPVMVEISDARGMTVGRTSVKLSAASFDEITYASQAGAPTGIYEVAAYLVKDDRRREMLGSTSFKVQEFEPDRLKVRLDFSDTPAGGWLRSSDVRARVGVAHLFGEAATGRRVEGLLTLTPALPRFARYQDYRFQIGEALPEPYQEQLAPATTDDSGNAEFNLDLKRFVGRAYRLIVLARAFEAEGGRSVDVRNSAIVSDAPYLVGIKPDGDLDFVQRASTRGAMWLAVDQRLSPVAADALTLEWVQRRYLSVLTRQDNGTYKYVSRLKEVVRDTRPVRIAAGGSRFPLPTGEPGDFVLVLRNAAGTELNRLSYTVAGQANLSRSLERNAELQVQLDKPAYNGGDTIQVSIRAPYVGAGLITIERERVFHHQWFKTTTTSSVQRVTLPDDFEGNGYVTVQFLRDPSSDELFMSPLSYGIAAFAPNLAPRTETVTLVAPRQVKPGTAITLRVTPSEPSRVAVLAVDEGILQVAQYRNPDPLGFFFRKRMLEVETRQILDLILPEFKRFMALAAPGGDAGGDFDRHLNPFNRKRKAPVAFWSGVVEAGPKGRDLRYTVPDSFNGRLRIVAIGVSQRRMGVAEAATEVKADYILTPNVPAMTAPGDEFVVSVGVFNNTSGGTGPIRLEAQGSPGVTVIGAATTELQIPDKREGVGEFRMKANAVLGGATLKFIARRGPTEARVEESVSVRPAAPYRTQLTLGRVDGARAVVPVTRDLFDQHRKVEAGISSVPLVWGQGLTAYLDDYEYSCTEQLVSKGVAALLLASRPEFGTVRSRAGVTSGSGDAQPVDAAFAVLRSRQNDSGGLGLWSSSPITAEFPTVYAAHLLVEAKDRGQKIPDEVLAALNAWLTRFASTPASTLPDARMRAYAVYLLVRQGIKPNAAISNVEQELTHRYAEVWQADLAAAYLASAYRLMQRQKDADRIISQVPWSSARRKAAEETYYDPVVHDAQLLYLLARHFPNRLGSASAAPLESISAAITANRISSLTAAYTLLALDAVAGVAAGTGKFGIAEVGKDGSERPLTVPPGAAPKVSIAQTAASVRFSREGSILAYYLLNESGFDRRPPAETKKGVEIFREFVDAKGNPVSRVSVGEEFLVRLRLRATDRDTVTDLAVVDLLPGGVEPIIEIQPPSGTSTGAVDPALARRRAAAAALPIGVPAQSDWFPDHIDVREDRLVLYGAISRTIGTFVYRVRATNTGTFQTPPAFAEGMYNRAVMGLSPAGTLTIVGR